MNMPETCLCQSCTCPISLDEGSESQTKRTRARGHVRHVRLRDLLINTHFLSPHPICIVGNVVFLGTGEPECPK